MGKDNRRKRRAKQNPFMKNILDFFVAHPKHLYNYKQVAKKLEIDDKAGRNLVADLLQKLVRKGELEENGKGKYCLHPKNTKNYIKPQEIEGIVDLKKTGKAYISTPALTEDVFIAANHTNHALNGDKVRVSLFPRRKNHKPEGQITEVLERKKHSYVGIIKMHKNFAFLVADNKHMPVDLYIPMSKIKDAKDGQKVIAKILDWPEYSKNPFAEVTKVLGTPGENEVEMMAILADTDYPMEFPKAALKESEAIPTIIDEKEVAKRRDFRNVMTITIDPADAKDFDDALSIRKLANGNWEVGVHIADVSHYVKPGTALDEEAYNRATSVYLVDRTIPMLPEKLSNGVCSLSPHTDKLTFSAVFEMDMEANVINQWFGKTIIHSDRRFNYAEVQAMIEGEEGDYKPDVMWLHFLAEKLRTARFKKGAITFSSEEVKFELDEKGKPIRAYIKEQKEANWLVEEFMLLANRKVAAHIGMKTKGHANPRTFIYRIHDEPNQEKLTQFAEFLERIGYSISLKSPRKIAQSMNELFQLVKGKGEEHMIESIAVRTMAKAVYSTINIGHYGLSFKYYTHFTSPIRRYPDLMVHRLLQHYLQGGKSVSAEDYELKCKHSSEMEKRAMEAERNSVKYKQIEYMLDKIGMLVNGVISGVSKWGIFVEVAESKSEGLVSFKDMHDDLYYLDEDNYRVVGYNNNMELKLGDSVQVKIKNVDLIKRQMDLELV